MTNTIVEEIKILQCERLFTHCKRISYINSDEYCEKWKTNWFL